MTYEEQIENYKNYIRSSVSTRGLNSKLDKINLDYWARALVNDNSNAIGNFAKYLDNLGKDEKDDNTK